MYVNRNTGLGDSLTSSLAQAIARFEGFNVSGSVAQRNHNPGNLRAGSGQVGTDSRGYAVFADDAAGWAALERQVGLNVNRGLTLREFFGGKAGVYPGYAPAADSNNPGQYADTVAGWIGIAPDVPLASQGSPAGATTPADLWEYFDYPDVEPEAPGGLSPLAIAGIAAAGLLGLFLVLD